MRLTGKTAVVVNARFLTQHMTGVQRFASEISLRLKEMLPHLKFLAPKNIIHKELAEKLEVETYGHFSGHLWEQVELPLYLKSNGSPLLLCLCNTAPIFYRNKIVCVHDLAFLINPEWFSKSFSSFYKLIIPTVAKSSVKVLTVSNYSKKNLVKYLSIPESEVIVLYNAVSESFAVDAELQANKYGEYILAVGSLDPRKNLRTLVEAYNQCKASGLKLVVAGAGSKIFNDPELHALVHNNPSITLTGYLSHEELVNAYRHAKVFVYPSLFEGFGIPPLEAMSCGCATIVSNSSSLPEVCGDASLYVDPKNPDNIADTIISLLSNEELRQQLIQKGYERVSLFNWKNSASKLANLIQEVA